MPGKPSLERLQQTWEELGRADPLWAVLSIPAKSGNRWQLEEFFRTGDVEVDLVMAELEQRSLHPGRRRALDFGCGVGRLSQALCRYFEEVDGVDIAPSMVETATGLNRHGPRCRYHLNMAGDLALFGDGTFDFVYSVIVLQHVEPALSERYMAEFVRVLRPGGVAIFQVPSRFCGPVPLPEGARRAWIEPLPVTVPVMDAGTSTKMAVSVRNTSPHAWPASAALKLGNHWRRTDGSLVARDDGRTPFDGDLAPGQEAQLALVVTAPPRSGRYVLELDVVEEAVTWFADAGSPSWRGKVEVVPASDAPTQPDDGAPLPEFEMHAVPTERVVALVEAAGGVLERVDQNEVTGPGWENHRYIVRKP